MAAKYRHVREHLDALRLALLREPRGHRDMFGALLTPPVSGGATFGVVFMDNAGYLSGCGHATIGIGTALVETGMVPAREPESRFSLDTLAGPVHLTVSVRGDRVVGTSFENVPAFLMERDASLQVEGFGTVRADIAFGGNVFAIVEAAAVGLAIRPDQASQLAAVGLAIKRAAREQVAVEHPDLGPAKGVAIVTLLGPPENPAATYRSTHVFGDGQVDRSPGGTGTSAVMAALHARERLPLGAEVVAEGLLGGLFRGRLLREVELGGYRAVIPEVSGQAFLTGFHQFVLDPDDPLPEGIVLS
jgi:proline racemase/trans-L-3-hydroxyproline dehydratase